jgi:hypothetical protein
MGPEDDLPTYRKSKWRTKLSLSAPSEGARLAVRSVGFRSLYARARRAERGTLRRDEPGEGEILVARSLGPFSLYSRARRAERGTLRRDNPGEGKDWLIVP